MQKIVSILMLASLAFASDVLEFTDSNFEDQIKEHGIILVEFFAPWCGHCKRLAPEYETAATTLKKEGIPIAKIDCTANGDTCSKYGVSGYPTLKIFRDGSPTEYDGPRESGGIIKKMRSEAGPASTVVESVEAAEKLLGDTERYTVVGFFSDEKGAVAKAFLKTAGSLKEKAKFAHTMSADVRQNYGYEEDDIVLFQPKIYHSKFEEKVLKYDDDKNSGKLNNWVNKNIVGLCGHRTSENADQFKQPLVVVYYDVDYTKNVKGTNYWRNRVMKVAKKLKEAGRDVNFAVSNHNDMGNELSEFNLKYENKPVVSAVDTRSRKFTLSEEFSMDTLEQFVNDFLDDKLEPYLKSEPVPEDNSGGVKVVVGKNFDEIVNDPERDVLIEFYAPWCGHCKNLEPKYTELGEKLIDEPGVIIAKMDATANDVPSPFKVEGFPTIYFKKKGSPESPVKYTGGREVKDFIEYLAKQSTGGLQGYDNSGKKKKKGKKGKTEL